MSTERMRVAQQRNWWIFRLVSVKATIRSILYDRNLDLTSEDNADISKLIRDIIQLETRVTELYDIKLKQLKDDQKTLMDSFIL